MVELESELISFDNVTNYNCTDMCAQEYCSNKYTKFTKIILNGVELNIGVCDKHAEEIEKKSWDLFDLK